MIQTQNQLLYRHHSQIINRWMVKTKKTKQMGWSSTGYDMYSMSSSAVHGYRNLAGSYWRIWAPAYPECATDEIFSEHNCTDQPYLHEQEIRHISTPQEEYTYTPVPDIQLA